MTVNPHTCTLVDPLLCLHCLCCSSVISIFYNVIFELWNLLDSVYEALQFRCTCLLFCDTVTLFLRFLYVIPVLYLRIFPFLPTLKSPTPPVKSTPSWTCTASSTCCTWRRTRTWMGWSPSLNSPMSTTASIQMVRFVYTLIRMIRDMFMGCSFRGT